MIHDAANTHPKLATILDWFEQIDRIPRGSKNEAAIASWLIGRATELGLKSRRDEVSNIVIEVPATPGYEDAPTVVIQGHMDMVCEKAKGSTHDFTRDPIRLVPDGDWLRADGTTLGADNGIALAMAMTAASADDVPHPPLELLFTVDEETGLTGANALGPDFITGKILLNVDSEDEGVFTVGCAGGRDTHLRLPIERAPAPAGFTALRVVVEGLKGGHSGVDIHEPRGNAVRVLAETLRSALARTDARLAALDGGTAHNAIPRDAEAVVFVDPGAVDAVTAAVARVDAALKSELAKTDPGARVSLQPEAGADPAAAWAAATTERAVDLLLGLPHGVDGWSQDIDGLVETSNNLASVHVVDGALVINTSQRSSVMNRLHRLTERIEAIGRMAGADPHSNEGYPSWEPDMGSPLLATCKDLYRDLFGREPVVEIIHAGLECGIIGAKYEGMDMISFGPTIENPHSPDERIEVRTIGQVWDFMVALLAKLR